MASFVTELAIVNQDQTSYQFSSNYDGTRFYVQMDYNKRNDTWYSTIKNADQEIILAGVANLTNVQGMTKRFAIDGLFPYGDLLVADSNDMGQDPTWENYGDDVSLFYVSGATLD